MVLVLHIMTYGYIAETGLEDGLIIHPKDISELLHVTVVTVNI